MDTQENLSICLSWDRGYVAGRDKKKKLYVKMFISSLIRIELGNERLVEIRQLNELYHLSLCLNMYNPFFKSKFKKYFLIHHLSHSQFLNRSDVCCNGLLIAIFVGPKATHGTTHIHSLIQSYHSFTACCLTDN